MTNLEKLTEELEARSQDSLFICLKWMESAFTKGWLQGERSNWDAELKDYLNEEFVG